MDESHFSLSTQMWRMRGKSHADGCVPEIDPWGGSTVMVRAGVGSLTSLRADSVL